MFGLTVIFGPGPTVYTLMFRSEERLRKELEMWATSKTPIVDDFGQECVVNVDNMHGYLIEDFDKSKLAHIERALHQARTQAKGTELADSDPVLRQARARAQGAGLGMIQPAMMGNGRFPPQ